jgi:hypothetical protein
MHPTGAQWEDMGRPEPGSHFRPLADQNNTRQASLTDLI